MQPHTRFSSGRDTYLSRYRSFDARLLVAYTDAAKPWSLCINAYICTYVPSSLLASTCGLGSHHAIYAPLIHRMALIPNIGTHMPIHASLLRGEEAHHNNQLTTSSAGAFAGTKTQANDTKYGTSTTDIVCPGTKPRLSR